MIRREFLRRAAGLMAIAFGFKLAPKPARRGWYAYSIPSEKIPQNHIILNYSSDTRWDVVPRAMEILEKGFLKNREAAPSSNG